VVYSTNLFLFDSKKYYKAVNSVRPRIIFENSSALKTACELKCKSKAVPHSQSPREKEALKIHDFAVLSMAQ
jgi:hypothetical protein